MSAPVQLRLDDADGIASFRAVLADAVYSDDELHRRLGVESFSARVPALRASALRVLDEDRLSSLIRLFVLGVPVPPKAAAAALAPLSVERAEAIGLLRATAEAVEPAVAVDPIGPWLVVSDRRLSHGLASDFVYSVAGHSRTLASITINRPAGSALDLGTGSGFQALLATTYAERVVATDLNPRALEFARFNAALNGVQLDLREGSVFEPVAGERFDVIVSNPPFVISPETAYVFRDSGLPGHSFCEGLVRSLPGYLREGGFGHVLVAWGYGRDEDWRAPVEGWLEDAGCDAILIRYTSQDALEYAAAGNRPLLGDGVAYGAAIDRWVDYFRGLGIDRIGWGGLVVRRRSGARNWFAAFTPSPRRFGPAGDHLLRLFAAQDYLRGRARDDALLGERLRPAQDLRVVLTRHQGEAGEKVETTKVQLLGGMQFQYVVDVLTAKLLSLLDGRRPLGVALAELRPWLELQGDRSISDLLPALERLLELGLVERVEGAAP